MIGDKDFLPPFAVDVAKRILRRGTRFDGSFASWDEAGKDSTGYDSEAVLSKVVNATRRVLNGEGAYERDSVVFQTADYAFPIVAGLLRAARGRDMLSVLDFGGSLGSTYRQCRPLLGAHVIWNVIEQSHFVSAGKAEFETDELRFYDTVADIPANRRSDAGLFSSTLQYLGNPGEALRQVANAGVDYIVVDRTPIALSSTPGTITVQRVSPSIYKGSYPMRIFATHEIESVLGSEWSPIADFLCSEGRHRTSDGTTFEFRGMLFDRRNV